MPKYLFSIIIPVVALNDYVDETVDSILNQTEDSWELFIVTNERQETRWPLEKRIMVLASGRVGPAEKRDLAANYACGKFLVFLDDDSYPSWNYLYVARNSVESKEVLCLGGPAITPPEDRFWQQVSGASFLSRLTGGAPERYRPVGESRIVTDWPSVNLIIRRDIFLGVGGFNSPYWPGEDTFLCWKLITHNVSIWYQPDLIVWHHRRSGLRQHLKQIAAYGVHRGYFMRRYPENSLNIKYFAPLGVLVMSLLITASYLLNTAMLPWLLGLYLVYLLVVVAGAVEIIPRVGFRVAIFSAFYVYLTHHVYAINLSRGIFRRKALVSKLR